MELKDRILEAMQHAGLKPLEFAKATGKTSGAVTQWTDGTTKSLKAQTASAIERATGYRAEWIINGTGERLVTSVITEKPQAAPTILISDQCAEIMKMLSTLPDDSVVRWQVMGQIAEVIARARGSPTSYQEPPAYSHAATRTAKQG